ncbi:MAG: primosomal protein N' [Rickettsiaceae bacterium]
MNIVKILPSSIRLSELDYCVQDDQTFKVGEIVKVPLRNKLILGIILQNNVHVKENINYKAIDSKLDLYIQDYMLQFIMKAANYYLHEYGSIVKLMLPVDISSVRDKEFINQTINCKNFNLSKLSEIQTHSLSQIKSTTKPSLVYGVTGSGKTEVYFHLIAQYLQSNKQVLLMLPEIALTHQIIERFREKFNFDPIIWNSNTKPSQKKKILRSILNNSVKLIIGTRSALFLPYPSLGLIVIDEEHDNSYKQNFGVLYNARDMAILRTKYNDSLKVVLCSATPSIETIYNIKQDKYHIAQLPTRFQNVAMPNIKIIDLRSEKLVKNQALSKQLTNAIKNQLNKKHQVLLFLNRRGYSPLLICKQCGYKFNCNSCSASLVTHWKLKKLECHHCGWTQNIPTQCPECSNPEELVFCGLGIEKLYEEVQLAFPEANIFMMSKDIDSSMVKTILEKMTKSEIDILIGTQIITKGYHFPNLMLVGIVDADLGFISGDLRSVERNYQLLSQVSGRAGREKDSGLVMIQTYYPDNSVFRAIINNESNQLLDHELNNRNTANMPPFTRMAAIILSGKKEEQIKSTSLLLVKSFIHKAKNDRSIRILGPATCMISKIANNHRYRVLIIAPRKFNLQIYIKHSLGAIKVPAHCNIKIDIDPYDLL